MKKILLILAVISLISLSGCTENQRAKKWGGNANITLPAGQKLVNVTWKDDNLWYLTRPMTVNETAETYKFSEESSWNLLEGTYTIIEVK